MIHMEVRRLWKQLSDFSAVVSHPVLLVLLIQPCGGQPQQSASSRSIVAMVGDDVVLPCQLDSPVDAVAMTMEWGRADMKPRFVLVWHDGKELLAGQNQAFKGRASLSIRGLQHGDVSLMLSSVKVSDSGTYRCYLQKLNQEHQVQLLVGASSSPAISLAGLHVASSAVVLHCETRSWYPEPEMLWMDAEGKLLSAGPPETLKGPDDLYSVSSSVTVEKRHGNIYTCRVQQRNINQTRETHITVTADLFKVQTSSAIRITIFSAVCIVGVVAVVLLLWRCGKEETKTTSRRSELQLLTEGGDKEKTMETHNEDLKENDGELELIQQVITTLMDQKKDLKTQRDVLISQQQEDQTKIQEIKKRINQKINRRKNKDEGKLENLKKREKEHQELLKNTGNLMDSTEEMINKMTERRGRILRDEEKIRKKLLKEAERKREETQSSFNSEKEQEVTLKTSE